MSETILVKPVLYPLAAGITWWILFRTKYTMIISLKHSVCHTITAWFMSQNPTHKAWYSSQKAKDSKIQLVFQLVWVLLKMEFGFNYFYDSSFCQPYLFLQSLKRFYQQVFFYETWNRPIHVFITWIYVLTSGSITCDVGLMTRWMLKHFYLPRFLFFIT